MQRIELIIIKLPAAFDKSRASAAADTTSPNSVSYFSCRKSQVAGDTPSTPDIFPRLAQTKHRASHYRNAVAIKLIFSRPDTLPTAHVQLVAATPGIRCQIYRYLQSTPWSMSIYLPNRHAWRFKLYGHRPGCCHNVRRWDCSSELVIMTVGP